MGFTTENASTLGRRGGQASEQVPLSPALRSYLDAFDALLGVRETPRYISTSAGVVVAGDPSTDPQRARWCMDVALTAANPRIGRIARTFRDAPDRKASTEDAPLLDRMESFIRSYYGE